MHAIRLASALAQHVVTVVLLACAGACGGSSSGPGSNAGTTDSGATDAGATDSRAADSASADSRVADSGTTDSRPAPSKAASCTDGVAGSWQNITPPAVLAVLSAEGLDSSSGGPISNGSWEPLR
jgi:hypothetical protein